MHRVGTLLDQDLGNIEFTEYDLSFNDEKKLRGNVRVNYTTTMPNRGSTSLAYSMNMIQVHF